MVNNNSEIWNPLLKKADEYYSVIIEIQRGPGPDPDNTDLFLNFPSVRIKD